MAHPPLGLLDGVADEGAELVGGAERLRRPVAHSTNGEGRAINSCRPGSSRAGRELIASHSATARSESVKRYRSAMTRCAASTRLDSAKSVRLLPEACTARSTKRRVSGVVRNSIRSSRARVMAIAFAFLALCPANVRPRTCDVNLVMSRRCKRVDNCRSDLADPGVFS